MTQEYQAAQSQISAIQVTPTQAFDEIAKKFQEASVALTIAKQNYASAEAQLSRAKSNVTSHINRFGAETVQPYTNALAQQQEAAIAARAIAIHAANPRNANQYQQGPNEGQQ